MNSFFYQTAQTLINQYPDRFPLLKITHIINWQATLHEVAHITISSSTSLFPILLPDITAGNSSPTEIKYCFSPGS